MKVLLVAVGLVLLPIVLAQTCTSSDAAHCLTTKKFTTDCFYVDNPHSCEANLGKLPGLIDLGLEDCGTWRLGDKRTCIYNVCGCSGNYLNASQGCADVNECKLQSNPCSQKCCNTAGSYYCECNQWYTLQSDKQTCIGPACSGLTNPINGKLLPDSKYGNRVPATVTFTCSDGYYISSGSSSRTCTLITDNGGTFWSGSETSCSAKLCPPLPNNGVLSNGSIKYTTGSPPPAQAAYTAGAVYSCNPGYELSSITPVTCNVLNAAFDPQWSVSSFPTCIGSVCNLLAYQVDTTKLAKNNLQTNVISTNGGPPYRHPVTVTFACLDGYEPLGNVSMSQTCYSNLSWDANNPTCIGKVCTAPTQTSNSTWVFRSVNKANISNNGRFPATVIYGCQPDHFRALLIFSNRTCIINPTTKATQWNAEPPECYKRKIDTIATVNITGVVGDQVIPYGTSLVTLTGSFGEGNANTIANVSYGPFPGHTRYQCTDVQKNSTHIHCTLAASSVGENMKFILHMSFDTTSPPTYQYAYSTVFRMQAPTIVSVTASDASNKNITGTKVLTSSSTNGHDTITITGTSFGASVELTGVKYGQAAHPDDFTCTVLTVTATKITCNTMAGEGSPLYFTVNAGGQKTNLSQVAYGYPDGPILLGSVGCVPHGIATKDCSTEGSPNIITIYGSNFNINASLSISRIVVYLAGNPVQDIVNTSNDGSWGYDKSLGDYITFPLPAGTGAALPVSITTTDKNGAKSSRSVPLVSYGLPNITAVRGCQNRGNCNRTSSESITLEGTNFGAGGAALLVCGKPATVTHDTSKPHEKLYAAMPVGKGVGCQLVLIVGGQIFFGSVAHTVSYSECPAGSYDALSDPNDVVCRPCIKGSYTDRDGQGACTVCQPGTFAPNDGAATCQPADFGYYVPEANATAQIACGPGDYSNTKGKITPEHCGPGTAHNLTAQQVCPPCNGGHYQDDVGSLSCKLCDVGKISSSIGSYVQCDRCSNGYIANTSGLSQCSQCVEGSYAYEDPENNKSECKLCPVGKFSGDKGTVGQCAECGSGTFANTTGRSVCVQCDPGYFSNIGGSVECKPCDPGSFADNYGAKLCKGCYAGYATNRSTQTNCDSCPIGKYSSSTYSTECTACPQGEYNNVDHATQCLDCNEGTFNNQTGQSECLECKAGTYAPSTHKSLCDKCPSGSYSDSNRSTSCRPCQPGTASDFEGATSCVECTPGSFTASSGSPFCSTCSPGKYADSNKSSVCRSCDAGTYVNETGAVVCWPCSPGYYQSDTNQASCGICAKGFSSGLGSRYCTQCVGDTISNKPGSSECLKCPDGAVADTEKTSCMCDVGTASITVGFDTSQTVNDTSPFECRDCPIGARCDSKGLKWDTLETLPGYWEMGKSTWYPCLASAECQGGFAVLTVYSDTPHTPCAANRDGPLCARCNDGFTIGFDNKCTPCQNDDTLRPLYFTLSVLAVVLVICGQYWFLIYSGREMIEAAKREVYVKAQIEAGFVVDDQDDLGEVALRRKGKYTIEGAPAAKPNITFKLKIAVGFAQISSNLGNGLEIRWPATFKRFINWFSIFNFDVLSATSVGCVYSGFNHYTKLIGMLVVPVALTLIIYLCYYVPSICKVKHRYKHDRTKQAEKLFGHHAKFWRLVLFTLFLMYPLVSVTIVRTFVCKNVLGVNYLLADFNVVCDEPEYQVWTIVAACGIVVYPVGIPIFFAYIIWSHRNRLDEVAVRARLGFLYDAYERSTWWWEIVDMLHKLACSFLAFLPWDYQMPVAMCVLALYTIAMLVKCPWFRKGDDRLALLAQAELILFAMSGNIFNQGKELDSLTDFVLTITLIVLFCYFVLFFFITSFKSMQKKWIASKWHGVVMRKIYAQLRACGFKKAFWKPRAASEANLKKHGFFDDLNVSVTRVVPQLGNKFSIVNDPAVSLARNPFFLQEANHGGAAMHNELNDEEIHPNVNPLHADLANTHFVRPSTKSMSPSEMKVLNEFSPVTTDSKLVSGELTTEKIQRKDSIAGRNSISRDTGKSTGNKGYSSIGVTSDQDANNAPKGPAMVEETVGNLPEAQVATDMGKKGVVRKKKSLN